MTTPLSKKLEELYLRDYYLWLETTVKVLSDGRWNELDVENLIEEIESMGRSEKRAIESNLVVLLLHILKWLYQPSMPTGSWKGSILEHRRRLQKDLKVSPSLNNYLEEVFVECYQDARQQAAAETGLPLDTFPIASPFTPDEALNKDYFSETEEQ